jgi:hypothetical protein
MCDCFIRLIGMTAGLDREGNDRLRKAQQRQAAADDSPERRNASLKRLRLNTQTERTRFFLNMERYS